MEENMNIELNEELLKEYENLENEEQDIQTTFNEDSIEDMNEDSVEIENANEEEIEGIGAIGFSMRTTKPSGNKNFMTTSTGGWSTCIKGSPNDPNATVLSNCVGYASSRFNEIINLARGTSGCTYKTLNCNAENFPERATAAGLKIGSTPRRGAIICWQKGSLSSSDGAGHVEVVERVDSNNQIYDSASNYGGTAFYNATRNNSNGRWGLTSPYAFRCFIYLPDDVQKWVDGSGSTPSEDISKKSTDELAREVIAGKYGNGDDRKAALGSRYAEVQARVNEILNGGSTPTPTPAKSNEDIAREVINGDWGNGEDRKNRLAAAGYDYNTIQSIVNQMLNGGNSQPAPQPSVDILDLVRRTIRGDFGNGQARKDALGSHYSEVQNQVNLNIQHGTTNWDNIRLY